MSIELQPNEGRAENGYVAQITLAFVNSRTPKYDSSRPYPLLRIPPIGIRGSDLEMSLMKTPPLSIFRAILCAASTSPVQIAADSPNSL